MTDVYGAYRPDQGPHALITGGGTGIGAAIAARLGGDGARVTVVGRRLEPLRQVADGLDAAHAVTFDVTDEARKELTRANPQGRFVSPEEVAETVAWLVGPHAGAITGQAIAVAGGEVM